MRTWNDYKDYIKETNPVIAKDVEDAEAISTIIGAMIEQRHSQEFSTK